ncbi:hypothetical protein ACIGFK_14355 [Streptomyces sp. NPDC085524]|uniref:terpene synthase family protein n=1 Tax=Streptomyces sp. NPDC085524 TaxID=3365728 RepID=UPI0037D8461A
MFFNLGVVCSLSIDDQFDIGGPEERQKYHTEVAPQLLAALDDPVMPDLTELHPHAALAGKMRQYTERHAAPMPGRLFIDGFANTIRDAGGEIASAVRGKPFTVDGYLDRIINGAKGANSYGPVVEICGNTGTLPDDEREHPAIAALTTMMGLLITVHLDFYTPWNEKGPDDHYNLIKIIAHEKGGTPDEAAVLAMELTNKLVDLFFRLSAQITPQVSPPTRRYVENLGGFLRGNLDWARWTQRYVNRSIILIDRTEPPASHTMCPPPYPLVAKWWDLLDPVGDGQP